MHYTEPVYARLINKWEGKSTNLATVKWYKMVFSIHLQDSLSASSSLSHVSRIHIDKGISFTVTQQSNDQIDSLIKEFLSLWPRNNQTTR